MKKYVSRSCLKYLKSCKHDFIKRPILLAICLLFVSLSAPNTESQTTENIGPDLMEKAAQILKATTSSGGLVVHLGSGDGKLTVALGKSGSYVVQGLDADAGNVSKARSYAEGIGLYGKICFDRPGNTLPYIDNLVNLLIVENPGTIRREEMMRVLAPGGRLYYLSSGQIETKPPMKGIDDWTHFMHDSTGNAVANDTIVSPPQYLKWVGGSIWSRSHANMGNMPGLVAAKGRVFSILDEGFVGKDQDSAPPAWNLIARDAYNGILLWSRPIQTFHDGFWGKKSGPIELPDRLVTDGDRVYATLDIDGPVSAVDAVTGKLFRDYQETVGTEEILCSNNVLFLLRNPLRASGNHTEPIRAVRAGFGGSSPHGENEKEVMAVNALTGEVLWKKKSVVLATTLKADDKHVYFHDGVKIVCLDRENGQQKWCTPPVARVKSVTPTAVPELIVHNDVVIFVGGLRYGDQVAYADAKKKLKQQKVDDFREEKSNLGRSTSKVKSEPMYAFDANSGEKLWEAQLTEGIYEQTKFSVFAIGNVVWTGDVSGGGGKNKEDKNPYTGRDLHTGEIVKQFSRDVDYLNYHSRCYPNKATVNYLMPNIRGVEMVDFVEEKWSANNWIRPGCSFGLMPSHGMVYTPPHACTCYAQSKVRGLNAVYGEAMGATKVVADPKRVRLETGKKAPLIKDGSNNSEWSTYRGNNLRTDSTVYPISTDLKDVWTVTLGGKLSAVTVADGRLFVSQIDNHTVNAISADTGKKLWSFTAGGRVDSPPTLYGGRAYFGCTDGYLYCLNTADGSLAWRFLAAADDRRLIAYDQIESVHPLNGSVLIQDGVIYCLAGRSMFLDGGLRLYRLDADTGKELSLNVMNEIDPFTGKNLQEKTLKQSMPPSMPDILSSDGKRIYMGVQPLDLSGKRTETETHNEDLSPGAIFALQQGDGRHIFSPQSFLDDSRFHRIRWVYGKVFFGGHQDEWRSDRVAPVGNILVCDEKNVFGYHGNIAAGDNSLKYTLFSVQKDAAPEESRKGSSSNNQQKLRYNWIIKVPFYINAMLLADQALFVAGANDNDEESLLQAYSASTGKTLAEYALPSMTVWDGMAAANGKLYISLKNGSIVCKEAK